MQTTHKIIEVTKVASLGTTSVSAASIVTFLKKKESDYLNHTQRVARWGWQYRLIS